MNDDVKDEAPDVVMEDDIEPTDQLKKLREKLAKCVEEKQGYLDSWQRDKAEFLNARKRDAEQQKDLVKFANEELIMDLLPVLDSFEMAKANKEAWEKVDKNWRQGIEYIQSQIIGVLGKNNLVEVNPIGADYSPLEHEAVEMVALSDDSDGKAKDGKIIEVLNKGYNLNGHAIRAPKVKVGEVKK